MLTALLHKRRKNAEDAARKIKEARNDVHGAVKVIEGAADAIEQTRRIYGTRLLVRGLLWASVYLLSRGLLELDDLLGAAARRDRAAADAVLRLLPLDLDEGRERDGRARAPH